MSYYVSKKSKLLKEFDRTAELIQYYLAKHYGEKLADRLYRETRQEYEKIIPEIPHIRGMRARALNSFLIITAQELAVYRVMKAYDKTPGETWEVCHEALNY